MKDFALAIPRLILSLLVVLSTFLFVVAATVWSTLKGVVTNLLYLLDNIFALLMLVLGCVGKTLHALIYAPSSALSNRLFKRKES
jgi:hypothetical protein